MTKNTTFDTQEQRESMEYDVAIVGAGPAGLSAAIRLKQLSIKQGLNLSVCVLEKGSEPGAHVISGAIIDPKALNELLPDWKEKNIPSFTPVLKDRLLFLSKEKAYQIPENLFPPSFKNTGNYLFSLSQLVRWLSEEAEMLGVEIFSGYAASEILYGEDGSVRGVATGSFGVGRDGKKTAAFQPKVNIFASYTFFSEGTRGHLGKDLISRFSLNKHKDPQSYAISIKEIWKIPPKIHQLGLAIHTTGWPLDKKTYNGAFLYHMPNYQIAIGLMIGLSYKNPYLSPYAEFQKFKSHPSIVQFLEGGECLEYGAKTLTTGGLQSLPDLVFPGGALIGCNAGFMNSARLKGIHTAMKSGMLAAEAAFEALKKNLRFAVLEKYPNLFKQSWLYEELHLARNFKPYMNKTMPIGALMFGLDQIILRGHVPWTLHRNIPDHEYLKEAKLYKPFAYNKTTSLKKDILSSLYLSGTHHNENQPSHLLLKNKDVPVSVNLEKFAGLESYYCPAAVYEFVTDSDKNVFLRINAANCLHCKTCDIKDPTQNITWIAPEGGDGPEYQNM